VAVTVEIVTREALDLPVSGRVILVEALLASLAGETNPEVERAHLDEIRRRRTLAREGNVSFVDGTAAFKEARAALRK
jgi:hypothetical protein